MLSPLGGVYGTLIKFALVIALLGGLYGGYKYELHKSYQEGVKVTEVKYDAKILAEKEVLTVKKREADAIIERDFAKREGEYNEKIKNLTTSRDSLLVSLQSRPARTISSGSNPASTSSTASARGAYPSELFREDAAAFINLARDAEEVRLGLIQCYRDYDSVKQSLESFNQK